MMENPIKQEAIIASASILATVAGGTLAPILASALGVGVVALGYLGEKRTKELFGEDQEYINKIANKMNQSDDFVSLVYDIWMKHNLESSETRRIYLRDLLKNATGRDNNDFQNFTRIMNIVQEISEVELKVFASFYSGDAYQFSQFNESPNFYRLNQEQVAELVDGSINDHDLIATLNQLGHFGLLGVSYNSLNGPYYWPVSFGKVFLEYIKS